MLVKQQLNPLDKSPEKTTITKTQLAVNLNNYISPKQSKDSCCSS